LTSFQTLNVAMVVLVQQGYDMKSIGNALRHIIDQIDNVTIKVTPGMFLNYLRCFFDLETLGSMRILYYPAEPPKRQYARFRIIENINGTDDDYINTVTIEKFDGIYCRTFAMSNASIGRKGGFPVIVTADNGMVCECNNCHEFVDFLIKSGY